MSRCWVLLLFLWVAILIGPSCQRVDPMVQSVRLYPKERMTEIRHDALENYVLPSCVVGTCSAGEVPFARGNHIFSICKNHSQLHPLDCALSIWSAEVTTLRNRLHPEFNSEFDVLKRDSMFFRDGTIGPFLSIASSLGSLDERRRRESMCIVVGQQHVNIQVIRNLALIFSPKRIQIIFSSHVGVTTADGNSIYYLFWKLLKSIESEFSVPISLVSFDEVDRVASCSFVYIVEGVAPWRDILRRLPLQAHMRHGRYSALTFLREFPTSYLSTHTEAQTDASTIEALLQQQVTREGIPYEVHWNFKWRDTNSWIRSESGREGCPLILAMASYVRVSSVQDMQFHMSAGLILLKPKQSSISTTGSPTVLSSGHVHVSTSKGEVRSQQKPMTHVTDAYIIITYDVSMFMETALGLQYVLRSSLHVKHVEIMGFLNQTRYLELQQEIGCIFGSESSCSRLLQIAIGPHRVPFLSTNYIIFHTENAWDDYMHSEEGYTSTYSRALQHARAILVYSEENINFISSCLHQSPQSSAKIFAIPMYSRSLYFHSSTESEQIHSSPFQRGGVQMSDLSSPTSTGSDPAIDFALLFSPSPRRLSFRDSFEDDPRMQAPNQRLLYAIGLDIAPCLSSFDQWVKEMLTINSAVVINVHQFPTSALETHRINLALSLGIPIVSEVSNLESEVNTYRRIDGDPVVTFTHMSDWASIWTHAHDIILNSTLRSQLAQSSRRLYAKIHSNAESLKQALEFAMREIVVVN